MPVLIPVKAITAHCHPYRTQPWAKGRRLTRNDVRLCLGRGIFEKTPWDEVADTRAASGYDHNARVAYLIHNPTDDPIDIEVGVPSLRCYVSWIVQEGNHRLAAAIHAKRKEIWAIVGGDIDYAKELLGVDCTEPLGP